MCERAGHQVWHKVGRHGIQNADNADRDLESDGYKSSRIAARAHTPHAESQGANPWSHPTRRQRGLVLATTASPSTSPERQEANMSTGSEHFHRP